MDEFRRPLHRRIAALLARMDGEFLSSARCYFGGGTQIVMANGEYRESRDIDFLVRGEDLRTLRETVHEGSLGRVFRARVHLAREVRFDQYGIRTFIAEDARAAAEAPIKFEIVVEGRIPLGGKPSSALGIPELDVPTAIAQKLLANADRGRDRAFFSRDLVDLAFFSARFTEAQFRAALRIARAAYGDAVLRELREACRVLEVDAAYRSRCARELLVEDPAGLREGVVRLRRLSRITAARRAKSAGARGRKG